MRTGTIRINELEHLQTSRSTVVLDVLPASLYRSGHIPGAMNVLPRLARRLAPILVPDKNSTVVVYGQDTRSEDAQRLARRLARLGYTDVRVFRGGRAEWMRFLLPLASVSDG